MNKGTFKNIGNIFDIVSGIRNFRKPGLVLVLVMPGFSGLRNIKHFISLNHIINYHYIFSYT